MRIAFHPAGDGGRRDPAHRDGLHQTSAWNDESCIEHNLGRLRKSAPTSGGPTECCTNESQLVRIGSEVGRRRRKRHDHAVHDSDTIKLFNCDLNWTKVDSPVPGCPPAMATDWAQVDAKEYFDWHVALAIRHVLPGLRVRWDGPVSLETGACGARQRSGTAAGTLCAIACRRMPFVSYFCVGTDLTVAAHRPQWIVPRATSTPTMASLLRRVPGPTCSVSGSRVPEEFPVEWLLFDWFVYAACTPTISRSSPHGSLRNHSEKLSDGRCRTRRTRSRPQRACATNGRSWCASFAPSRRPSGRRAPAQDLFNIPY